MKINTYGKYLKHSKGNILKIEEAFEIYEEMAESVEKCCADYKKEIWQNCLEKAAEYTKIRNDWEFMDRQEKADEDESRAIKHNSFIANLNALSRMVNMGGNKYSWREKLGDDRIRIGDFACFISFITGISNR